MALPFSTEGPSPADFFRVLLRGADRKNPQTLYRYRLKFRNPDSAAVGCVLICEVRGGRAPYQIAVERDSAGRLQLHCTCADAVFRAESEGRFCKHVQGLLEFGRMDIPAEELPPSPPSSEASDPLPQEGPGFGSLAG